MTERKGHGRRAEDRIAARIINAIRLVQKILAAAAAAFAAGMAAIITVKAAWTEVIAAFFRK